MENSANEDDIPKSSNHSVKNRTNFQGVPTHSQTTFDTSGLRRSQKLVALKIKKHLYSTINHASFSQIAEDSGKEVHSLKETCTFKEAMKIPHERELAAAMEK